MTETGPDGNQNANEAAPGGGRTRSRGFLAVSAIALIAGVSAGVIAFGATRGSGQEAYTYAPPTVAAARTAPAAIAGFVPDADDTPPAAIVAPTADATQASATATGPAATATVASSASAAPTLGEAWSATPAVSTPGPAVGLSAAAGDLIADIEASWGIRVVTEGQDWGRDEAAQLKNLGALAGALESLPAGTVAAATHNSHGTLTVLSNDAGRTEAGWQPYGGGAANFYSTEDVVGGNRIDSSQVVLQTGSTRMTIAHELLHAYQMRDIASGRYAESLLTPEMKSFMQMSGWVQTVSDEELAASLGGSWTDIAALFRYEGHELIYISEIGEVVHAFAPNPVEAFAVTGALYYAAPDGTQTPPWPEHWAWFDSNLD